MPFNKIELGGILKENPKFKEEEKRLKGGDYRNKFKTADDIAAGKNPEELLIEAEEAGLRKGEVEKQIRGILEEMDTKKIGDENMGGDHYRTGYENFAGNADSEVEKEEELDESFAETRHYHERDSQSWSSNKLRNNSIMFGKKDRGQKPKRKNVNRETVREKEI